jgi:lysophospholipase L1-like esterase
MGGNVKTGKLMQMVSILTLCSLLLSCTPQEQEQVISLFDQAQKTAVSAAKTESAPLQTQAAEALQTQIAQGGEIAKTKWAEGREAAKTQVAALQQTAAAQVATEAAKILSTRMPTSTIVQPPEEIDYFALGDSIASGHGLQSTGNCKRSTRAYPYLVKEALVGEGIKIANFKHLACSGATASEPENNSRYQYAVKIYNPEGFLKKVPETQEAPDIDLLLWLHNQVLYANANINDSRPTLITISIGANDLGWTDFDALFTHLSMDFDGFDQWAQQKGNEINKILSDELFNPEYGLMNLHPNTYVIINTIYNPITEHTVYFLASMKLKNLQACVINNIGNINCYERASHLVNVVNLKIITVATKQMKDKNKYQNRIKAAGVYQAFEQNKATAFLCDIAKPETEKSWVQYIKYPNSNEVTEIDIIGNIKIKFTGDCFHPNIEGAKGIAGVVKKQVASFGWIKP